MKKLFKITTSSNERVNEALQGKLFQVWNCFDENGDNVVKLLNSNEEVIMTTSRLVNYTKDNNNNIVAKTSNSLYVFELVGNF